MIGNSVLLTVLKNRNFWLALLITVTASIGNVCVRQPVNMLSSEVGLTASVFGIVASIYVVFSMLGSGPFSNLIEYANRKTWILSGQYVARGLVFIGFAFCASAPVYIFLRFMQGLMFGMGHIAMMIVIAETMDKRALGSAFGLIVLFTKLISSVTNSVTLQITASFGISYSCLLGAAFSFIPALLCLFLIMPPKPTSIKKDKAHKALRLSTFINIRAVPLLLIMMFVSIPSLFIDNFMMLYGKSSGLTEQAGNYITSYMWWMGIGSFLAGYASDKFGFKGVAIVTAAMGVFSQLALGFSTDALVWMVSSVGCGIAAGGISAVTRAFSVSQCPSNRVALTVATLGIMQDVSNLLGSSLGGFLADSIGYAITFRLITVFPVIALLMLIFLLPKLVSIIKK